MTLGCRWKSAKSIGTAIIDKSTESQEHLLLLNSAQSLPGNRPQAVCLTAIGITVPFDIAELFIERSVHAGSNAELTKEFVKAIQRLGFQFFACASHVSLEKPPLGSVLLHNYPQVWVHAVVDLGLDKVDPVLRFAETTSSPFSWDAPEFQKGITSKLQRDILSEAAELGLSKGWTIPIHTPGSIRASCSVVPDAENLSRLSYRSVQIMATHLYSSASHLSGQIARAPYQALSKRERECLEFSAQGKTDWEISRILKLSEHTVRHHFERAKRKLRVFTRTQAIVHALYQRQISFRDVIRALPEKDRPPIEIKQRI